MLSLNKISGRVYDLARKTVAYLEPTEKFYLYVSFTTGLLAIICFLGGHSNICLFLTITSAVFFQKEDYAGVDLHKFIWKQLKKYLKWDKKRNA